MLGQVQLEMLVATLAENLACLDDLRRQTVAVADGGWTRARLNELRRDAQLTEIALFLKSIGFEHFQEL